MKFTTSEVYNAVVFKVAKKLQGGPEAQHFHDTLKEYMDAGKVNFIMDLSDVTYVNSTGMGILVRGLTTLKNAGGDLKLAGMSTKVQGLLSITKLSSVFTYYDSVEEAAKSF